MRSDRRQLDHQLWVVDFPEHSSAGLRLGARSTLIETDRGLWVHSPGPLANHLDGLPEPTVFIAPNSMHYLYLAENVARFPEAQAFAPPELLSKVPTLPARTLTTSSSPQIQSVALGGLGRLGEWVFYHQPSRTLVVTDLVFHLREVNDLWTRLVMHCNGAYGRVASSRLFRAFFVKSRQQLRASLQGVLDWDFQRLIMAHGQVVENGGKDALSQAFGWLLKD